MTVKTKTALSNGSLLYDRNYYKQKFKDDADYALYETTSIVDGFSNVFGYNYCDSFDEETNSNQM